MKLAVPQPALPLLQLLRLSFGEAGSLLLLLQLLSGIQPGKSRLRLKKLALQIQRLIPAPVFQPVAAAVAVLPRAMLLEAVPAVFHIVAEQARHLFRHPVQHALLFQLLLGGAA